MTTGPDFTSQSINRITLQNTKSQLTADTKMSLETDCTSQKDYRQWAITKCSKEIEEITKNPLIIIIFCREGSQNCRFLIFNNSSWMMLSIETTKLIESKAYTLVITEGQRQESFDWTTQKFLRVTQTYYNSL